MYVALNVCDLRVCLRTLYATAVDTRSLPKHLTWIYSASASADGAYGAHVANLGRARVAQERVRAHVAACIDQGLPIKATLLLANVQQLQANLLRY